MNDHDLGTARDSHTPLIGPALGRITLALQVALWQTSYQAIPVTGCPFWSAGDSPPTSPSMPHTGLRGFFFSGAVHADITRPFSHSGIPSSIWPLLLLQATHLVGCRGGIPRSILAQRGAC